MLDFSFTNLLAVAVIAVIARLVPELAPRFMFPAVVLEIVLGIVVGPDVLGWVEPDAPVLIIALVGLAFLLFLAGLEIDLAALRGPSLRTAAVGSAASLAIGLVVGVGFAVADLVSSPILLAVALSATSLGLVIPILKDANQTGPFGRLTIISASVADVTAIILLSLLFSTMEGTTTSRLVVFGGLMVSAVLAVAVIGRVDRLMPFTSVLARLQDTTAEIRIRLSVVLMLGFVAHPQFRVKLEAIGYGFVIPVFFVTSGLRFDLGALLDEPSTFARVPLFLAALLLVRGLPAVLLVPRFGPTRSIAAGLLLAVSLPFLVTAAEIGVAVGAIQPVNGAALVASGLLSVLIFPSFALSLLKRADSAVDHRSTAERSERTEPDPLNLGGD